MKYVISATCSNCGKESNITISNLLPNSKTSAVVYGCGNCGYEDKEIQAKISTISGEPQYEFETVEDVISVGTTGGDTIESQLKQLLSNSITVYGAGTDPKAIVSGATDYLVSELLQLFHSLLISKLPEKKPTNSAFEERRLSTPESVQNSAYNSAISDMYSTLNELFGVSNE